MSELRDSFAPGSAKYDIVQDAIDYLEVLATNSSTNPNYISDLAASTGQHPFTADKIRKTHSSILADYTAAQLAEMQVSLTEYTTGVNPNPQAAQKVQWVLDANAY